MMLIALQRQTPSLRASSKVRMSGFNPVGNSSPTTADSHSLALASNDASYFAAFYKGRVYNIKQACTEFTAANEGVLWQLYHLFSLCSYQIQRRNKFPYLISKLGGHAISLRSLGHCQRKCFESEKMQQKNPTRSSRQANVK